MLESWINFQEKRGKDFAAKVGELLSKEYGDTPPLPSELEKFDKEWQRQASELIKLGFHKELGMTEKAYVESLPKFTPQPKRFIGIFDIPVIVDPRINWIIQCKLAEIFNHIPLKNIRDWEDDPKEYKTPETPYVAWMQEEPISLYESAKEVRKNLPKNVRGATIYDGLSLVIFYPELINAQSINLPGSSVDSDSVPYLDNNSSGLSLRHIRVKNFHFFDWGSVSCGR